jgi:hypothetical protein
MTSSLMAWKVVPVRHTACHRRGDAERASEGSPAPAVPARVLCLRT